MAKRLTEREQNVKIQQNTRRKQKSKTGKKRKTRQSAVRK